MKAEVLNLRGMWFVKRGWLMESFRTEEEARRFAEEFNKKNGE